MKHTSSSGGQSFSLLQRHPETMKAERQPSGHGPDGTCGVDGEYREAIPPNRSRPHLQKYMG
jgi:hypothetical protein